MADETSMTPGGVKVRSVPNPQVAPFDGDPDTAEALRAHGIEISWALTENGWRHVVRDGERQVYATEFFDDAFRHAKTYGAGKLGVARDQVAIPASPGAASSGDRISISGDTAPLVRDDSDANDNAASLDPSLPEDNDPFAPIEPVDDEEPADEDDAAPDAATTSTRKGRATH